MEDIDPAGFHLSHDVDPSQIRLELFRLATMFLSSDAPVKKLLDDIDTGKSRGPDFDVLFGLAHEHLYPELSRILIYTAIQSRILSDRSTQKPNPAWQKVCGQLEQARSKNADLGVGPLGGKILPLTLREALNKIIHAEIINTDTEGVEPGEIPRLKLTPVVYLYGRQNNRPWRATLNIVDYVCSLHSAIPRYE